MGGLVRPVGEGQRGSRAAIMLAKPSQASEVDHGSVRERFIPFEDTQRSQRVPAAGSPVPTFQREMDLARMRVLEQPGSIRLLLGAEQINRFTDTSIRLASN